MQHDGSSRNGRASEMVNPELAEFIPIEAQQEVTTMHQNRKG